MTQNLQTTIAETAAEAVEGAEVMGLPSARDVLRTSWRTARGTRGAARRATRLAGESAKILAGRSEVAPSPKDWRFRDAAWSSNPAYHRLMQLYLAATDEFEGLVRDADLGWRDAERAQFLASLLSSALSPTNTLAGNPEALKHLFETGGLSAVRGMRNAYRDLRHNGGLPSQVDRDALKVGVQLATSPGAVVYRDDVFELIQYTPSTPEIRSRPVVLVPPQIGKFYFMDLRPGRSFIEHAVARGIPVCVISWRNPGPAQRDWDLETYAAAVVRAIDVAREIYGVDDVNLLAFCAGGILSAAVLGHLAASNDERVNSISFGVTLLDFDARAMIGAFDNGAVLSLARARSNRQGVLPGRTLGAVFALLRPNDLVWNYFVNNYLMGNAPPVFDILAWNADSTNLPGRLHSDFLEIFHNNGMATPGSVTILGTPIDLGRVTCDTYVTGATTDHLTPWKGCYRTTQLLGGESTFILSNAGHIASLVNPPGNPKAHFFAGPDPVPDPDEWLARAERRQGTWWEHWAEWVTPRSGPERRAPARLGSRMHRPMESAPGTYVHELAAA